jgi:hypothetical protein
MKPGATKRRIYCVQNALKLTYVRASVIIYSKIFPELHPGPHYKGRGREGGEGKGTEKERMEGERQM